MAALKKLEKSEREKPAEQVAGGGSTLIYLLCDGRIAKPRCPSASFARSKAGPCLPAFEGDATAVREANQHLLATCDAVILFTGPVMTPGSAP